MSRTITIKRPPMHPKQAEVLELAAGAPFGCFPCGRRFGKSVAKVWWLYEGALESGGVTWDVWPSYPVSKPGWRAIKSLATQIRRGWPGVKIREADREVHLPNGGVIAVKTADRPESLVAEGLVRAAVDEAAIVQERAVEESLAPTLLDNDGRLTLWGVPKGRNWFHTRYLWGQDPNVRDWVSATFPTFDNPHLPDAALERIRENYAAGLISDAVYRQEYLAEFLDDSAGVFRRVTEATGAVWQDGPVKGHSYAFGVDWGKLNDFTVIAVWDLDLSHLVHLDRFNQIDYTFQVGRLEALAKSFRPVEIVAEQNSMGEPLVEQLRRLDLPVRPFVTTSATKNAAIERLALDLETGAAAIVPDDGLVQELQALEMTRTATGTPKYGAPAGLHNDRVMAAAIGYTSATEGGAGVIVL